MYSSSFDQCWEELMRIEGRGLGTIEGDPGGSGKFGLSEDLAKRYGLDQRNVTEEQMRKVAWVEFWTLPNIDDVADISLSIAFELFEYGYWAGTLRPCKLFQEVLNDLLPDGHAKLTVDGSIANKTLTALMVIVKLYNGERAIVASMNGEQYLFTKERGERAEYMRRIQRGLRGSRLFNPFLQENLRTAQTIPPTSVTPSVPAAIPQQLEVVEATSTGTAPSFEFEKVATLKGMRRLAYVAAFVLSSVFGMNEARDWVSDEGQVDEEAIAEYILERVREGLEDPDPLDTPIREMGVRPVE